MSSSTMKANIKLDFLVHDLLQTSPLSMSSRHKNCVETMKMYLYNLRLLETFWNHEQEDAKLVEDVLRVKWMYDIFHDKGKDKQWNTIFLCSISTKTRPVRAQDSSPERPCPSQ